MNPSITQRLMAVAALSVALLLPLAGMWLSQAFRTTATVAYDEKIAALMDALVARVESSSPARPGLRRQMQDARFEQVYSGWYWQLSRDGEVIRTSRSLWDVALESPPPSSVRQAIEARGPGDQALRGLRQQLLLADGSAPVDVLLLGPQQEIELEVQAFNRLLWQALGSLGLILLAVFAIQIRWGLAPLRRMRRDLRRVRQGEQPRLDEALPGDLRALATSMNEVLEHQEALVERGRVTAGNLAHALKQPLAAMRMQLSEADLDPGAARDTLRRIDPIIEHHLSRAAAAGRAGGQFRRIDLRVALQPVVDAIRAMATRQGRGFDVELPSGLRAAVDPQDVQEMIGNLLENAVRAASSRVRLSARETAVGLQLSVEDDGPGLSAEAFEEARARGLRLDERQPGSGLGLAIVSDLARLYGWRLDAERGDGGGLRVVLTTPREKSET